MIGIVLSNMIPSQILWEVEEKDVCFFIYDNIYPYFNIKNPVFPIANVSDFKGDLWVFELDHAKLALKTLNQININFFVWNLEWLHGKTDYLENIKIYREVDNLFCRPGHSQALENYCNRRPICKSKIL